MALISAEHRNVRKTTTIDDDVSRLIAEEMERSGDSFKDTIKRLLRLGLAASESGAEKPDSAPV